MDPITLSALIGGGTSLFGGLMSGKAASKSAQAMREQAQAMNRIAGLQEQSFSTAETIAQPFRDILFPQMEDILSGDKDVTSLPYYSTLRGPLEAQFSRAKESIQGGARGGSLESLLAGLEMERARSVGAIPGQMYREFLEPGLNLAGLNISQAPLSLASAAGTRGGLFGEFSGINQQNLGQLAGFGQGIGSSLFDLLNSEGGGFTTGSLSSLINELELPSTSGGYGLDVDLGIFG